MKESVRDGHDADLSALHVEHLRTRVARRRVPAARGSTGNEREQRQRPQCQTDP